MDMDQSQPLSSSQGGWDITFTVSDFSQLEGAEAKVSEKQRVDGFLWRMMVIRKEQTGGSQGSTRSSRALGVYLQKIPEPNNPLGDVALTSATITLVNQTNPSKSVSRDFTHTYSSSSTDWGFSSFMKWKDLTNPAKGFITEDNIVLKAEIKVAQEETSQTTESSQRYSILNCPVCNSDYKAQGAKQPMSLRCGHTFCSDCLDKKCTSTAETTVTITCTACNQVHSGASSRELWFPNHTVIQMIGNIIPKSKYFCETHKQNMDYYCFEDSCLVCIGCAYQGTHAGHSCKLVREARADLEGQLGLTVKKIRGKSSQVSRKLELLRGQQKSLKSQEDGIAQVVEEAYKRLEEIIHRQKESQLKELREHMEEFTSTVDANIRSIEEKSSEIQQALSDFKAWQALSVKDALQKLVTLKSRLEAAGSLSLDVKPSTFHDTSISFVKPLSEVFSEIENQLEVMISQAQENTGTLGSQSNNADGSESETQMPPNKRKKLSQ